MSYEADPRVDAYIDILPEWQREVGPEVRDLVHEADAEVAETIRRSVQPYRSSRTTAPAGGVD